MLLRPFVTANFAITADGRISTRKLTPSDFSSPRDKRRLLEIRAKCDAVLVGARTLAADTMSMGLPAADLRAAREKRGLPAQPLRVLVSNSGKLSPALRVFADGTLVVVFSTTRMPAKTRDALAPKCDLFLHDSPGVNLPAALATLRTDYAVKRLVCEGGGTLFRAFVAAGLVDELHLTLCPRVFGGSGAITLTGLAGDFLPRSAELRVKEMISVGDECFVVATVLRATS